MHTGGKEQYHCVCNTSSKPTTNNPFNQVSSQQAASKLLFTLDLLVTQCTQLTGRWFMSCCDDGTGTWPCTSALSNIVEFNDGHSPGRAVLLEYWLAIVIIRFMLSPAIHTSHFIWHYIFITKNEKTCPSQITKKNVTSKDKPGTMVHINGLIYTIDIILNSIENSYYPIHYLDPNGRMVE